MNTRIVKIQTFESDSDMRRVRAVSIAWRQNPHTDSPAPNHVRRVSPSNKVHVSLEPLGSGFYFAYLYIPVGR